MKKVLLAILAIASFSVATLAQTKEPVKKNPTPPVKVEKKAPAQTATAQANKPAIAKTTAKAPVKKNGTPDMRYKENKKTAEPKPHLKKDGTKDKRFKENKKQN